MCEEVHLFAMNGSEGREMTWDFCQVMRNVDLAGAYQVVTLTAPFDAYLLSFISGGSDHRPIATFLRTHSVHQVTRSLYH